jgi:hypothetical protein
LAPQENEIQKDEIDGTNRRCPMKSMAYRIRWYHKVDWGLIVIITFYALVGWFLADLGIKYLSN